MVAFALFTLINVFSAVVSLEVLVYYMKVQVLVT